MIPNLLTTVRLGLVPVFVYFMLGSHNLYAICRRFGVGFIRNHRCY